MKFIEAISIIQLKKKKRIKNVDVAEKLGTSKQYINNIDNNKDLSQNIIEKLEDAFDVKFNFDADMSSAHTLNDFYEIKYWERCEEFGTHTINPNIRSYWSDKELSKLWNRDYHNLRIINMFTDKMAGGTYPIYQNDVILFDKDDKDISNSGVYVFTTEVGGKEHLFIAGLSPKLDGSVLVYYGNEKYEDKLYSYETLKSVKLKVIGRVLKDISITI